MDTLSVLMEGLGAFAGVVVDLFCDNKDYRRRVIDFILSGAFIPSDEYERAKRIMGFHFEGVEQAFRLGFAFRNRDLRFIKSIPYTEETLTRLADTHFLALVPSGVHTRFRDSPDDVIQTPEEYIRESVDTCWHWVLYRLDPVLDLSDNEILVPLYDALYVREVNGITHQIPLLVGNTFKANGDQLVLVPRENSQYSIRHLGTDKLRSCVMVKPDKV